MCVGEFAGSVFFFCPNGAYLPKYLGIDLGRYTKPPFAHNATHAFAHWFKDLTMIASIHGASFSAMISLCAVFARLRVSYFI